MTERERAIRTRLRDDLPHFAAKALQIQPKSGGLVPLRYNFPQLWVHQQIEAQRAREGRVRVLILKARKQGVSTYAGSRYFHQATNRRGLRALVMTHHSESTAVLFEMVRRFYLHLPEVIRPTAARNSTREIFFSRLDSFYSVATAGGKGSGRGTTPHLFHGSEVAFWSNGPQHRAGVLQAVAKEPGTEVILETTGNGRGDVFFELWAQAVKEENEYLPLFLPWFADPTYRAPAQDFLPTQEEAELGRLHGLDREQLAWRRGVLADIGSPWRFQQEYPATPDEAFSSGTDDPMIAGDIVLGARRREVAPSGPVFAAIDPARSVNRDRSALVARQGGREIFQQAWKLGDAMRLIGALRPELDRLKPKLIFVDVGGLGGPIFDRLKELRYPVVQVNFGGAPMDGKRYKNARSEMWGTLAEWLLEAQIMDSEELQSDLVGPSFGFDSMGRKVMESKEDMRDRGLASPDFGDALAMAVWGPEWWRRKELKVSFG